MFWLGLVIGFMIGICVLIAAACIIAGKDKEDDN